jgi:hypothetical protein
MMKRWSRLVYMAIGIAIGVLVGASVTGFAAGDNEKAPEGSAPGRYEIVAIPYGNGGYYAFVLDTQTGLVRYSFRSSAGGGSSTGSGSW